MIGIPEMVLVLLLLAVVFGIFIFLTWFFIYKARHKERLLLIEKGMHPDELANKGLRSNFSFLKLGIVVIGLSIGLIINAFLIRWHMLHGSDAIMLGVLGICGGTASIIAHYLPAAKR